MHSSMIKLTTDLQLCYPSVYSSVHIAVQLQIHVIAHNVVHSELYRFNDACTTEVKEYNASNNMFAYSQLVRHETLCQH
jgi:hypothetical protein